MYVDFSSQTLAKPLNPKPLDLKPSNLNRRFYAVLWVLRGIGLAGLRA